MTQQVDDTASQNHQYY